MKKSEFLVALVVTVLVGLLCAGFLKADADAVCHSRAMDSRNVTLCRNGSHAVTLFGEIECECDKEK